MNKILRKIIEFKIISDPCLFNLIQLFVPNTNLVYNIDENSFHFELIDGSYLTIDSGEIEGMDLLDKFIGFSAKIGELEVALGE